LRFDPGADILKRFIYFLNYIFRLWNIFLFY
jgi:hypothetical protein